MFRKFFAALVAVTMVVGGLFAEEIKGAIFKKYEDGKATFVVDEKEKTFKVDEKAMTKMKKEDVKLTEAFGKFKADSKFTLTVEKDVITEAKRDKSK